MGRQGDSRARCTELTVLARIRGARAVGGITGLFVLLHGLAACSRSVDEAKPAKWPGCSELRAKIDGTASDLVLSELTLADDGHPWKARLGDLVVAIPEGEYDVSPRRDEGQLTSLMLSSPGGEPRIMIIRDLPAEPIEDIWQKVDGPSSEAGIIDTTELFGGPSTAHDLSVMGYQYSPADLSCDVANADRERAIAVALSLTSTDGPGELEAVYHDAFGGGELAFLSRHDAGRWRFEAQLPTHDAFYYVTLHASSEEKARNLASGLRLSGFDDVTMPEKPSWLRLLWKAAADGASEESWRALVESLRR